MFLCQEPQRPFTLWRWTLFEMVQIWCKLPPTIGWNSDVLGGNKRNMRKLRLKWLLVTHVILMQNYALICTSLNAWERNRCNYNVFSLISHISFYHIGLFVLVSRNLLWYMEGRSYFFWDGLPCFHLFIDYIVPETQLRDVSLKVKSWPLWKT